MYIVLLIRIIIYFVFPSLSDSKTILSLFCRKSFYWQQYFGHKCRIGNSYKVDLYDTIIHIVSASLQIKMQLYSLQPHKSHDEISFIDKWLSLSIPNRNKTERMTPNINATSFRNQELSTGFFPCHAKHRYIRDIIVIRARNFDLESVNGSNSRIIHKLHETIIWMGCREYGDSICRQCSFDQMIYIIRHLWCCCNQSITA